MSAMPGKVEGSRQASGAAEADASAHGHPTWQTYLIVGVILTVITAAEVAVFYMPPLRPVLVPILLVLSGGKFALVAMFYMHLRFDSPIFSAVFVAPLTLAIGVVVALIILFHVFPHGLGPLSG